MPIIPEGFGQAAVVFHAQSALPNGAVFTWGFINGDGVGAPVAATTIANDLVSSGMHDLWCDDVAPIAVQVKLGPNDVGQSTSTPYTQVGGQTGTVGAAATSMLVRKNTLLGGSHGRGRMYIPGQSESAVEIGGVIQSATLTDCQSRVEAFWQTLIDDALDMTILHDDPAISPTPVHSLTVDAMVATQRRRQRR